VVKVFQNVVDAWASNRPKPEESVTTGPQVWVAWVGRHGVPDREISVHATSDGAHNQIQRRAQELGVPVEQLVTGVSEQVVRTP
jgi:hypothetical protein